jgi:hypothetical protein
LYEGTTSDVRAERTTVVAATALPCAGWKGSAVACDDVLIRRMSSRGALCTGCDAGTTYDRLWADGIAEPVETTVVATAAKRTAAAVVHLDKVVRIAGKRCAATLEARFMGSTRTDATRPQSQ